MFHFVLGALRTHFAVLWLLYVLKYVMAMNFCFDANRKGERVNASYILQHLYAKTGFECIYTCMLQDECCRSVNYRKNDTCDEKKNCELLHVTAVEEGDLLMHDLGYDHYILQQPVRKYNKDRCEDKKAKQLFNASNILSSEPVKFSRILKEWLPKLPGDWTVCWRATRDDWESSTFYKNCANNTPTLVIVKVEGENKNYVFGGFANKSWAQSDSHITARGSFIFSLRNNDDISPFKAPLKNESDHDAIGSSAGKLYFGDDLIIYAHGKVKSELGSHYQAPPGYALEQPKTTALLAGSVQTLEAAEVELFYLS